MVNQAVEAAEVREGEPTNQQTIQVACPRKKSRSQSMTIIITLDQPSRHRIMRRLQNSSLTTLLRPWNMETISGIRVHMTDLNQLNPYIPKQYTTPHRELFWQKVA